MALTSVRQKLSLSWLPVMARDGAAAFEEPAKHLVPVADRLAQALRPGLFAEEVPRDDEHIHRLAAAIIGDAFHGGAQVVRTVDPPQPIAQMPVRGVENPHTPILCGGEWGGGRSDGIMGERTRVSGPSLDEWESQDRDRARPSARPSSPKDRRPRTPGNTSPRSVSIPRKPARRPARSRSADRRIDIPWRTSLSRGPPRMHLWFKPPTTRRLTPSSSTPAAA